MPLPVDFLSPSDWALLESVICFDWDESKHPRNERGQFISLGDYLGRVYEDLKFKNAEKNLIAPTKKELMEAATQRMKHWDNEKFETVLGKSITKNFISAWINTRQEAQPGENLTTKALAKQINGIMANKESPSFHQGLQEKLSGLTFPELDWVHKKLGLGEAESPNAQIGQIMNKMGQAAGDTEKANGLTESLAAIKDGQQPDLEAAQKIKQQIDGLSKDELGHVANKLGYGDLYLDNGQKQLAKKYGMTEGQAYTQLSKPEKAKETLKDFVDIKSKAKLSPEALEKVQGDASTVKTAIDKFSVSKSPAKAFWPEALKTLGDIPSTYSDQEKEELAKHLNVLPAAGMTTAQAVDQLVTKLFNDKIDSDASQHAETYKNILATVEKDMAGYMATLDPLKLFPPAMASAFAEKLGVIAPGSNLSDEAVWGALKKYVQGKVDEKQAAANDKLKTDLKTHYENMQNGGATYFPGLHELHGKIKALPVKEINALMGEYGLTAKGSKAQKVKELWDHVTKKPDPIGSESMTAAQIQDALTKKAQSNKTASQEFDQPLVDSLLKLRPTQIAKLVNWSAGLNKNVSATTGVADEYLKSGGAMATMLNFMLNKHDPYAVSNMLAESVGKAINALDIQSFKESGFQIDTVRAAVSQLAGSSLNSVGYKLGLSMAVGSEGDKRQKILDELTSRYTASYGPEASSTIKAASAPTYATQGVSADPIGKLTPPGGVLANKHTSFGTPIEQIDECLKLKYWGKPAAECTNKQDLIDGLMKKPSIEIAKMLDSLKVGNDPNKAPHDSDLQHFLNKAFAGHDWKTEADVAFGKVINAAKWDGVKTFYELGYSPSALSMIAKSLPESSQEYFKAELGAAPGKGFEPLHDAIGNLAMDAMDKKDILDQKKANTAEAGKDPTAQPAAAPAKLAPEQLDECLKKKFWGKPAAECGSNENLANNLLKMSGHAFNQFTSTTGDPGTHNSQYLKKVMGGSIDDLSKATASAAATIAADPVRALLGNNAYNPNMVMEIVKALPPIEAQKIGQALGVGSGFIKNIDQQIKDKLQSLVNQALEKHAGLKKAESDLGKVEQAPEEKDHTGPSLPDLVKAMKATVNSVHPVGAMDPADLADNLFKQSPQELQALLEGFAQGTSQKSISLNQALYTAFKESGGGLAALKSVAGDFLTAMAFSKDPAKTLNTYGYDPKTAISMLYALPPGMVHEIGAVLGPDPTEFFHLAINKLLAASQGNLGNKDNLHIPLEDAIQTVKDAFAGKKIGSVEADDLATTIFQMTPEQWGALKDGVKLASGGYGDYDMGAILDKAFKSHPDALQFGVGNISKALKAADPVSEFKKYGFNPLMASFILDNVPKSLKFKFTQAGDSIDSMVTSLSQMATKMEKAPAASVDAAAIDECLKLKFWGKPAAECNDSLAMAKSLADASYSKLNQLFQDPQSDHWEAPIFTIAQKVFGDDPNLLAAVLNEKVQDLMQGKAKVGDPGYDPITLYSLIGGLPEKQQILVAGSMGLGGLLSAEALGHAITGKITAAGDSDGNLAKANPDPGDASQTASGQQPVTPSPAAPSAASAVKKMDKAQLDECLKLKYWGKPSAECNDQDILSSLMKTKKNELGNLIPTWKKFLKLAYKGDEANVAAPVIGDILASIKKDPVAGLTGQGFEMATIADLVKNLSIAGKQAVAQKLGLPAYKTGATLNKKLIESMKDMMGSAYKQLNEEPQAPAGGGTVTPPPAPAVTPSPSPAAVVTPSDWKIKKLPDIADELKKHNVHEVEPTWGGGSGTKNYGGVVFNHEGKILLRKESHGGWAFPKATAYQGPVDAAVNKVQEKTGVKASVVGLVPGSFQGKNGDNHFFVMQSDNPSNDEGKWVTPDEARQLFKDTLSGNQQKLEKELAVLDASLAAHANLQSGGKQLPKGIFTWPTESALPNLKTVKQLGGSTGAKLVEDEEGNKFVMKRGNNPGHLREEYAADQVYQVMGLPSHKGFLYETPDGPVMLTKWIDDVKPLGDALKEGGPQKKEFILNQARRGFALDAILGNWDVVGQSMDNMMVDSSGFVHRIDNGGSLRYRAQGAKKQESEFGPEVPELETMRDPTKAKNAARIFSGMDEEEVKKQVREIALKKNDILKVLPAEIRDTVAKRIAWAYEKYFPVSDIVPGSVQTYGYGKKVWGGTRPDAAKVYKPKESEKGHWFFDDWTGSDEIRTEKASDADDLPASYKSMLKAAKATFNTTEVEAIEEYSGSAYHSMNKAMRKCPEDLDCLDSSQRVQAEAISSALAKCGILQQPATVWRHTDLSEKQGWSGFLALMQNAQNTGKAVRLPGFKSCSTSPTATYGFGSDTSYGSPEEHKHAFCLEIKARTGAYIRTISSHKSEYEFVQDHGCAYKVVGVKEVNYQGNGKRLTFQLEEVIPEELEAKNAVAQEKKNAA